MHARIFRDRFHILTGLSRLSLLTRLVLIQALASSAAAQEVRMMLDRKGWDARYPGRADLLELAPSPSSGPAQNVRSFLGAGTKIPGSRG